MTGGDNGYDCVEDKLFVEKDAGGDDGVGPAVEVSYFQFQKLGSTKKTRERG
jgi:hypothetical protein